MTYGEHCIKMEGIDLLIPPTEKRSYRKLLQMFKICVALYCNEVEVRTEGRSGIYFCLQIERVRDDEESDYNWEHLRLDLVDNKFSHLDIAFTGIDKIECVEYDGKAQSFLVTLKDGTVLDFH